MDNKHSRDHQPRQRKAIRNLLDQHTSRTQRRRRNKRSTVVVDHRPDHNVDTGNAALAEEQRASIVSRVPHFGHDREEGRGAAVGEDQGRHGRDGLRERRVAEELVV